MIRFALPLRRIGSLLMVVSFLSASCAHTPCWDPQNPAYPTSGCIIARGVVDCTEQAFVAQKDAAVALVLGLIATGTVDIPALLAALTQAGLSEGECVLALISSNFLLPRYVAKAGTANMSTFAHHWRTWQAFQRPGVIYRL
jgi:hypothetical protein